MQVVYNSHYTEHHEGIFALENTKRENRVNPMALSYVEIKAECDEQHTAGVIGGLQQEKQGSESEKKYERTDKRENIVDSCELRCVVNDQRSEHHTEVIEEKRIEKDLLRQLGVSRGKDGFGVIVQACLIEQISAV